MDNLSNLAHNELMCTHWLWDRAAAERVLIFQVIPKTLTTVVCKMVMLKMILKEVWRLTESKLTNEEAQQSLALAKKIWL